MAKIRSNANAFRGLAFVLLSLATILFVFSFGWLSGLVAIIVAMMTAGSLVVLLQPFSYVSLKTVAGIYFSVLLLEIII
ncbi:hypothetical protein [Pedobacter sp. Leaf132]|uniref:hypothetical protein n=1 Tax=Pedobacter sp. Leaf132 TaxID=2876557 RepID=UPI001E38FAE5|nr:hypothetical protein [Pedobacter sp. Leaf132]